LPGDLVELPLEKAGEDMSKLYSDGVRYLGRIKQTTMATKKLQQSVDLSGNMKERQAQEDVDLTEGC
jgi:hypothetical protein